VATADPGIEPQCEEYLSFAPVAPIPKANIRIAMAVKPGDFIK
jgi:hypothetical protein